MLKIKRFLFLLNISGLLFLFFYRGHLPPFYPIAVPAVFLAFLNIFYFPLGPFLRKKYGLEQSGLINIALLVLLATIACHLALSWEIIRNSFILLFIAGSVFCLFQGKEQGPAPLLRFPGKTAFLLILFILCLAILAAMDSRCLLRTSDNIYHLSRMEKIAASFSKHQFTFIHSTNFREIDGIYNHVGSDFLIVLASKMTGADFNLCLSIITFIFVILLAWTFYQLAGIFTDVFLYKALVFVIFVFSDLVFERSAYFTFYVNGNVPFNLDFLLSLVIIKMLFHFCGGRQKLLALASALFLSASIHHFEFIYAMLYVMLFGFIVFIYSDRNKRPNQILKLFLASIPGIILILFKYYTVMKITGTGYMKAPLGPDPFDYACVRGLPFLYYLKPAEFFHHLDLSAALFLLPFFLITKIDPMKRAFLLGAVLIAFSVAFFPPLTSLFNTLFTTTCARRVFKIFRSEIIIVLALPTLFSCVKANLIKKNLLWLLLFLITALPAIPLYHFLGGTPRTFLGYWSVVFSLLFYLYLRANKIVYNEWQNSNGVRIILVLLLILSSSFLLFRHQRYRQLNTFGYITSSEYYRIKHVLSQAPPFSIICSEPDIAYFLPAIAPVYITAALDRTKTRFLWDPVEHPGQCDYELIKPGDSWALVTR